MTFHICIVCHLFFVCAGKMTEDSRITPPYWSSVSASPSLEASSAAGRSQPPTSSSSSLACFASSSLLWPAFTDQTVHQEGGTHFRTAKSQGWLSPRAVLHHGCMKNPAGSARVGMGVKPFVWSYFIPNTGESGGCRSRGKCFMIAVSKCSSNQLQLACKHSQEGPVQPGNSWGHTHTNALVEFAVFEIIEN